MNLCSALLSALDSRMQPLDVAGAPLYVRGVLSSLVEGERPRKRWWRYIPLGGMDAFPCHDMKTDMKTE